ncbi:kinase-like domain-containing protein [Lipomyces oligophaga]|uniref:kinase-like domain-containing protein n=1 Tax=Lipomyces oligophaga TaxID=45792 RepID=UPI0034CF3CBB
MVTESESEIPTLPQFITDAIDTRLISQGAEALVFLTSQHPYVRSMSNIISTNVSTSTAGYILKYRPPKAYRHPTLDAQLTKHRTLSEARCLYRLFLADINVPAFIGADPPQGLIWMENIEGVSLKQWIWNQEFEMKGKDEPALRLQIIRPILLSVGNEIAKLHFLDMTHGDLTTSNILLRSMPHERLQAVIIDFGLAQQSTLAEDKAVDLYVLERAFSSTHPLHAEQYVDWLLDGYTAGFGRGRKTAGFKVKEIMRKLDAVRLRGRKRSMVG